MTFDLAHQSVPQSADSEEYVLGSILIDPNAMQRVTDTGLQPRHFYTKAHQIAYKAFLEVFDREGVVDLNLAAEHLDSCPSRRKQHNTLLDEIGGKTKLANLFQTTVTSVNVDIHAEQVRRYAANREVIAIGQRLIQTGYDRSADINALTDRISTEYSGFLGGYQGNRLITGADASLDFYSTIEFRAEVLAEHQRNGGHGQILFGHSTGLYDLDALLGGIQSRDKILIAGRPGMGKSTFAQLIAVNLLCAGVPVLFFPIEDGRHKLLQRMHSILSRLPVSKFNHPLFNASEWGQYAEGAAKFGVFADRLFIEERASKPEDIHAAVRQFQVECARLGDIPAPLVIIFDYVQCGIGDDVRVATMQRVQALVDAANDPDTNNAVITVSQLNRGVESRNNKRPMLSDLAETNALEALNKKILLLYRDEYYNLDTPDRGIAEVHLAKNSDGPTGTVKLLFDPANGEGFRNQYTPHTESRFVTPLNALPTS